MKAFSKVLYKTLLYTFPIWILAFYIEYRLSALENSYSYKIRNFSLVKDSCEILVLGNSQMLKGINPALLPGKAYNMANVSQDYSVEELFLRKNSYLPKLKTVIIGMSYTSFGEVLENEEEWRLPFYEKYYDIDIKEEFDIRNYSNIMRYMPYESLKMSLKNFKVDLIKDLQPNGWMKMEGQDTYKLSDEWAKKRADIHTKGLHKKNIKKNRESLEDIIGIFKRFKTQIIIVLPPVKDNYLKNLDPEWLAINTGIMRSIEKKYDLKIMDYTQYSSDFNDCFNDVDHLNKKGATKFSLFIRNYISNNNSTLIK